MRFVVVALVCVLAVLVAAEKHDFSVQDMVRFHRVADPSLAPDGKQVATSVRTWDPDTNVVTVDLWTVQADGAALQQITSGVGVVNGNPVWSHDSAVMAFTSTSSGAQEVWMRNMQTGTTKKVSSFPIGVDNLKWSPSSKWLLFTAEVYPGMTMEQTAAKDKEEAARRSTGRVYDQLFIRHWNEWFVGKWSHVFAVAVQPAGDLYELKGDPIDLMWGVEGDCPVKPFGAMDQFNISPDEQEVAYTTQLGRDVAWTTDLNVYTVPIRGGAPRCISCENKGKDMQPLYSLDGKSIAFMRISVPVSESALARVMFYDRATNATTCATQSLDRSVDAISWLNSTHLLLSVEDFAREKILALNIVTGAIGTLMGVHSSSGAAARADGALIVFGQQSMTSPQELFALDLRSGKCTQLTDFNGDLLAAIDMNAPEEFSFTGANGDAVYGWIVKPPRFDPSQQYPVALFIHGGPEGAWTDSFSYRWNEQAFAGAGYVLVAINPHGSTGYGEAFTHSIFQNWGGWPFEDLMRGMDYVLKTYPYMDSTRVGALGASYGGYMINWLNGHTDRFQCLVFHDGLFDLRTFYYSTEELFFLESEMGSPPYEDATFYREWSPDGFVAEWATPTLVVHSEQDFRIPLSQGIATFSTLQRLGVPSKMLFFPDECHWVLDPNNSILWHDTVLGWLDQWLNKRM